jgi:hypothetical protein
MTYEQTREQFLLAWNSNAYLNMCESDDMHNAIVALEKQIPRKPVEVRNEIVCPTCKTLVGSSPYCRYCGQALDWSDNNA